VNDVRLQTFMKDQYVSFDDTEIAFRGKSDADLNRAYWLFKIIGFPWLVKISPPFVKFALAAHLPVKGLIRKTIFKHFCGGETISDCSATISELALNHIGTILDYSVEGKESEEDFKDALNQTLMAIERAKDDSKIPFTVFKPTGFAPFRILEKKNSGDQLNAEEEMEYIKFTNRIKLICSTAFAAGVPVFIDAEESWIQDSVDELATEMMMLYNKDTSIVYNTLQMYRHDRLEYLHASIKHASENNYKPGFKIVRGAYMEKERKRAADLNYPSPIHAIKENTDHDYNAALKICIEHIEKISLCCGTHNEESCLNLVEWMNQKGFPNDHPHIWFSQLYGMSDHISFNLAEKGYNVSKYVPYGPVKDVLPYLIRRAQENTSVSGQVSRELGLIMEEKKRRKGK
jgi:proline dehydrogenase